MNKIYLTFFLMINFTVLGQLNEETLKTIEQKYGEQWDFCTCVVKNDSINKAFLSQDMSDEKFDELIERFDFVDSKCKAALLMYKTKTPEERAVHEQRVKDCLREEE